MLGSFWHDFLYQPIFNLLIWIYSNWTDGNLGWAVVYITILLRIALLPFTLINDRNHIRNLELYDEVRAIEHSYKSDPVMKREEIRKILKKRRIQPWSTAIVLGMHALMFLLLYQVFISGIQGNHIFELLYPSIDFPGKINTNFYGFSLGVRHDTLWAGLVAVLLAVEIYFGFRRRRGKLSRSDLFYFILFPLVIFFFLWTLPMVKSLFVCTTILISIVMARVSRLLFRRKKKHA